MKREGRFPDLTDRRRYIFFAATARLKPCPSQTQLRAFPKHNLQDTARSAEN